MYVLAIYGKPFTFGLGERGWVRFQIFMGRVFSLLAPLRVIYILLTGSEPRIYRLLEVLKPSAITSSELGFGETRGRMIRFILGLFLKIKINVCMSGRQCCFF